MGNTVNVNPLWFIGKDETIKYQSIPNKYLYTRVDKKMMLLGLVWAAIIVRLVIFVFQSIFIPWTVWILILMTAFLLLTPFVAMIRNIINRPLMYTHASFIVTDKRVYTVSGYKKIGYRSMDIDKISNAKLTASPIQRVKGCGTIEFNTNFTNIRKLWFEDIKDADTSYKQICTIIEEAKSLSTQEGSTC